MDTLNILSVIKKSKRTLKEFIFENYDRQIRFTRKNSYYSMTHQKKKDLLLLVLIMLIMLKNIINHF